MTRGSRAPRASCEAHDAETSVRSHCVRNDDAHATIFSRAAIFFLPSSRPAGINTAPIPEDVLATPTLSMLERMPLTKPARPTRDGRTNARMLCTTEWTSAATADRRMARANIPRVWTNSEVTMAWNVRGVWSGREEGAAAAMRRRRNGGDEHTVEPHLGRAANVVTEPRVRRMDLLFANVDGHGRCADG